MFDRRTAARREWSVWWRYAACLVLFEVLAFILCGLVSGSSALVGASVLYATAYAFIQLVILGIGTAILVRYHVRTLHVWIGAAIVNAPLLIASIMPYNYWFPCYLASTILSIVWIIVTARVSFSVADPRFAHLCRKCFYDLRGLRSQVCPECGTPIDRGDSSREHPLDRNQGEPA